MELGQAERAVFAAITAGDKAWSSVEGLVRAGHAIEIIDGLMPETDPKLTHRNLLVRWNHPGDGECVTLTPGGAYLWEQTNREGLELAERPATVIRPKRVSKVPPTEKQKREAEELKQVNSRVPYWVEGGRVDPARRKRLREHRAPLPELVRAREPEFMMDEATDEMLELFTRLFDGTKVQGIKVKIDPKLKGAKGKAKEAATAKRRKAG